RGACAPRRDEKRVTVGRGEGKLRDRSRGRDASDFVPEELGEPQVAVRTLRNAERPASWSWERELGEGFRGSKPADVADVVAVILGEPQVAVRTRGNIVRARAGRGNGKLRGCPRGRHPAYPVCATLRAPEVAIRTGRDSMSVTLGSGYGKIGDRWI